ncbi:hypothetical protein [Ralstonia phage RP13]|nr:hypothetical protein [Ralstonia phage RP13]
MANRIPYCTWFIGAVGENTQCKAPTKWKMEKDDDGNDRRDYYHFCCKHATIQLARVEKNLELLRNNPDIVNSCEWDEYDDEQSLLKQKAEMEEIINKG